MIEQIQIDKNILGTDQRNCMNAVFCEEDKIVRCLTTHKPIEIFGEIVTQKEMELSREMLTNLEEEFCAECLHKIIAYRKEHKDLSEQEIKQIFLGLRAEDFFGLE